MSVRREEFEAKLSGPEVPPECYYLADWFNELMASRGSGGLGIASISYQEVESWARLTRRNPTKWEVSVIMALDLAYRAANSGA